jgi:hypothetical protein
VRATRASAPISVFGVLSIWLVLLAGAIFPQVEDPWPDRIGFEFPFVLAGAGAVLAGIAYASAPRARRERAIGRFSAWGFWIGVLFYAASVVAQVVSSL